MRAVIFDLDGVIYKGDQLIEGVVEVLRTIRKRGLKIFFLTNNSMKSRLSYYKKLKKMGIQSDPNEIMTSSYATALYLKGKSPEKLNIFVIGEKGLKEELFSFGFHIVGVEDDQRIDYVVAGIDRRFNYRKLAKAQSAIFVGAQFIATNRDSTYPTEHGLAPGAGTIIAAIETATNTKPKVMGKPEVYSVQKILDMAGEKPEEVMIVGDRLDTDILVGKRLGLKTALVLTGVTNRVQLGNVSPNLRPDYVIHNTPELLEIINR